ncbi:hypothetical protein RZS08_32505 [Arthrospira platensis SPKY1]|nr:hypothetical protein [Arthrospira platensis SPKY1]
MRARGGWTGEVAIAASVRQRRQFSRHFAHSDGFDAVALGVTFVAGVEVLPPTASDRARSAALCSLP